MPRKLTPTALTPKQLVDVLRRAGSQQADAKNVAADIEQGAPTNQDGAINLMHYAAWLAGQLSQ